MPTVSFRHLGLSNYRKKYFDLFVFFFVYCNVTFANARGMKADYDDAIRCMLIEID